MEAITVKSLFNRDDVKNKFQELLGKRSTSFITSVLQIVASNELLAKAEPTSIYQAAAMAATLDLPLNNALGFAYLVPFNNSYKDENGNWQKKTVAQFQIGAKGFRQLALRSGQFTIMHSTDVREGEVKKHDRLTGEMEFQWIESETERESKPIVGYVSFFKLINGFSQTFYMTREKLLAHGKKYSQTFKNDKGLWKDDENSMMLKTITKLNLSKNAPLSVDMQKAMVVDQAVINDSDTLDVSYEDRKALPEDVTVEELQLLLDESAAELTKIEFEDAKRIIGNNEKNSFVKLKKILTDKINTETK
jgi:recombination protein RecT